MRSFLKLIINTYILNMKKLFILRILIFSICILVFHPCYSKWEKFREHKIFTEYFQLESVKKINNFIYVWSMIDYKEPQKSGNLSTKFYSKYDCSKKRYQIISIIEYKNSMGRGRNFEYTKNITYESADIKWVYPSFESVDYTKIKFMCNY